MYILGTGYLGRFLQWYCYQNLDVSDRWNHTFTSMVTHVRQIAPEIAVT